MRRSLSRFTTLAIAVLFAAPSAAVATQHGSQPDHIGGIRVIASATIPRRMVVDATLVGGLSGIDYDSRSDSWVAISDDRSVNAPARYYHLDLAWDAGSITTLELTSSVTLLQANGEPYPNARIGGNVPDLEAIRFDPQGDALWYGSEGSRELDLDPFVAAADSEGRLTFSTAPASFAMFRGEGRGARESMGFEGLTFSADGASLWAAMEGPLLQDGSPSTVDSTSFSRITNIDREGNVIRQFAFEVDRLPAVTDGFATIGVTEILAIDDDGFLILQRAATETSTLFFSTIDYHVKVYEVSVLGATDISGVESLEGATFTPMRKRLVLDLGAIGVEPVGNFEGMSWGPALGNGNRSLVLVADDNFSKALETRFVVLEVAGPGGWRADAESLTAAHRDIEIVEAVDAPDPGSRVDHDIGIEPIWRAGQA